MTIAKGSQIDNQQIHKLPIATASAQHLRNFLASLQVVYKVQADFQAHVENHNKNREEEEEMNKRVCSLEEYDKPKINNKKMRQDSRYYNNTILKIKTPKKQRINKIEVIQIQLVLETILNSSQPSSSMILSKLAQVLKIKLNYYSLNQ